MKTTILALTLSILSVAGAARIALGAETPAPAQAAAKTEMQHVATCTDGKEYFNASGKHGGACRGHGGVAAWADGSPVHSKAARSTEYR